MAPNVLILSFAKSILKVEVDWILWAKAAIVPGLVTLFLIPWLVYKIYPPEIKKIDNLCLRLPLVEHDRNLVSALERVGKADGGLVLPGGMQKNCSSCCLLEMR